MKKILMTACAIFLSLGLTLQDAEAKRLGGGTSRGMQRESVTQRQATPQPAAPVQQAAPHQPAAQPLAQPQKRNWMGPLAGLAAGIGLAALFSHLGMGEGMGNMVMILLLVVAAVFVFKLLFRRNTPQPAREPFHFAGIGGPGMAPLPDNRFEAPVSGGAAAQPATAFSPARNIPADFDVTGFVRVAKVNFLRLQAANDAGNLEDIREFTTPEMFAEIKLDFDDRRGAAQETDVINLEAELLEVVTEATRHIASVRFHGQIREEKNKPAEPFDEVWNLVKAADGSRGWQVAGIQQLN